MSSKRGLQVESIPRRHTMTDVLLAHAFFLRNDPKQQEKMRPYPPLGTLYIASQLREAGFSVALFDPMFSEGCHELRALLDEHRPHIVAFCEDQFNFLNKMCLSHARDAMCEMSQMARESGAVVIVSGADVSDHPDVYFSHGAEYALVGEADRSLVTLVEVLRGRRSQALESIPGLLARASANGHHPAKAVEPERHPDAFPFPAWDLLDVEPYRAAWLEAHGYFSLNLVTTRGCPFHCNWCAKPIWGQRYAMRSPANVAEEMAVVKRTLKPDHIWFADDIFGLQPHWVAEFADEVQARDAAIPFMIQSRIDLMTQKAVDALARAGCVEVWLGVESGSQKILDAMDKGTKLPQIPVARERLRKAKVKACFFIQFGYPGETLDDIFETVDLVRKVMPDDIGVSVSYPLPGTQFYDLVKTQLDGKDHWQDSNDLAMMFQGTYRTDFYRKLHKLLHRDLDLRHRLRKSSLSEGERCEELDRLNRDWFELGQMETQYRSDAPTSLHKPYDPLQPPDLTRRWN